LTGAVDVDPFPDPGLDPRLGFSTRNGEIPDGPRARSTSTMESTTTSPFTSKLRVNVDVKVNVDDPDL
jgi:hypothetical protein